MRPLTRWQSSARTRTVKARNTSQSEALLAVDSFVFRQNWADLLKDLLEKGNKAFTHSAKVHAASLVGEVGLVTTNRRGSTQLPVAVHLPPLEKALVVFTNIATVVMFASFLLFFHLALVLINSLPHLWPVSCKQASKQIEST